MKQHKINYQTFYENCRLKNLKKGGQDIEKAILIAPSTFFIDLIIHLSQFLLKAGLIDSSALI